MENLLSFVFALAVIVSIIVLVTNISSFSLYKVILAQKKSLEQFRGDVFTFYRTDGTLIPTDHILYITKEVNGEFNITNGGVSDVYSLRLVCWNKDNPPASLKIVEGKGQPVSIEVLPSGSSVEYNIESYFNKTDVENNKLVCVISGLRFVRAFEVHG